MSRKKTKNDLITEDVLLTAYNSAIERGYSLKSLLNTVSNLVKDVPTAINLLESIAKMEAVSVNNDMMIVSIANTLVKQGKINIKQPEEELLLTDEDRLQLISLYKDGSVAE